MNRPSTNERENAMNNIVRISHNEKELARQAASMLGKLGGASRSEAKRKASRENGRKGGRPRKDKTTKAE